MRSAPAGGWRSRCGPGRSPDRLGERGQRTVVAEGALGAQPFSASTASVSSSRCCAASTVASQTKTAPVCSAWPVSTGFAGTQTKYSALPSASIRRSSLEQLRRPDGLVGQHQHLGRRPGGLRLIEVLGADRTAHPAGHEVQHQHRPPRREAEHQLRAGVLVDPHRDQHPRIAAMVASVSDGNSHILTCSFRPGFAGAGSAGTPRSAGRRTG